MICPHASGGRGWIPTAYDAATKLLYLPMVEACMDLVPVPSGERGFLSTGVRPTVRPRPESDGKYGRLQAINLQTKKTVWVERQRAPVQTGALVTAGGLVFAGSLDRMINGYDSETGAHARQTRLNDAPELRADSQLFGEWTGVRRDRGRSRSAAVDQLQRARAGDQSSAGPRGSHLGLRASEKAALKEAANAGGRLLPGGRRQSRLRQLALR